MITLRVTPAQLKALDELLNYVISDELNNYDGCRTHIYRAIHKLAVMRGMSDVPSPHELDQEIQAKEVAA